MRREIEWTDKLPRRVKRSVRISFPGGDRIHWQFKRSDEEEWESTTRPTAEEWARLEEKVEILYRRRGAPYRDLELVRAARAKAGGAPNA